MTNDNEPTPINGTDAAPEASPARSVAILAHAVELDSGKEIFELNLREPGIVRAVGFWLKVPKVLGSANMRKAEPHPHPELFVESDPNGAVRKRQFAFIASNRALPVYDGYEVNYIATAIRANEVGHLFEIVEVQA